MGKPSKTDAAHEPRHTAADSPQLIKKLIKAFGSIVMHKCDAVATSKDTFRSTTFLGAGHQIANGSSRDLRIAPLWCARKLIKASGSIVLQ